LISLRAESACESKKCAQWRVYFKTECGEMRGGKRSERKGRDAVRARKLSPAEEVGDLSRYREEY
jgi:hypothetical protein